MQKVGVVDKPDIYFLNGYGHSLYRLNVIPIHVSPLGNAQRTSCCSCGTSFSISRDR